MNAYQFVISTVSKTGADTARCGQLSAQPTRGSAAHALARIIVGAGTPDGPVEARGDDGRLRYTVKRLHAMAKFTVQENPKLHLARWVEWTGPPDDAHGPVPGPSDRVQPAKAHGMGVATPEAADGPQHAHTTAA